MDCFAAAYVSSLYRDSHYYYSPLPLTPDEAKIYTAVCLGLLFCFAVSLLLLLIDTRKDTIIRKEEMILTICRTSFWNRVRGRLTCTFHGIPVEIRISKSFINYVKAITGLKCGDSIRVLLSITQVYDKVRRAYVNQSYSVKEFRELIPAPEQPTLPGM